MNKFSFTASKYVKYLFIVSLIGTICGCNYVSYTPKNKKEKLQQRPPITLFDKIIAFRIEQNSWPISKEDFMSKGIVYKQAMEQFQFLTIKFEVKDTNNMKLTYYNHPKDVDRRIETNKIELNTHVGIIQFTKEQSQFIWKKIKY